MHPLRTRVVAETLRTSSLEDVARALGYRRDPGDAARWRRPGSVVSINRFMFYDHLRGKGGAGAIELAAHALGCSTRDALDVLDTLPHRPLANTRRQDPRWPALRQDLVGRCGLAGVLVDLARTLGLIEADRHGRPVFLRRDAAGEAVGIETAGPMTEPADTGGFWMSWEPEWPVSVILAASALDALSILSLHLVPAQHGCAVVSTGAVSATIPPWIETWNPRRLFCAWQATPDGDDAARRLFARDTRIIRMRPGLDGESWNDMLIRERGGEPLETDDRSIP